MFRMSRTVTAGAAATLLFAAHSNAEQINYNVWVPPSEIIIREGFLPYFARVTDETDGKLTFQLFTAGQMMGPRDTMPAIRDGALQGGFVQASSYRDEFKAVATFEDIVAFAPDPIAGVGATLETFFNCPQCLEEFEANNIVALGGQSTAPYSIMCTKELKSVDDLKSLRFRGSVDFHFALIDALGASGKNVPFGDTTQAFERGNIDCLFGGPTWIFTFGIEDLIKSRVAEPNFGSFNTPGMIAFRRAEWDRWGRDIQEVLIRNAAIFVADTTIASLDDNEEARKKAEAANMKEVVLGPELVKIRDEFLVSERSRLIESAKKRGFVGAEALLDEYLVHYREWEKLSGEIGRDRQKFADLLWERIYSKVSF